MKLNDKILYCRKKQGLSQEALAEKLGVSRQAVSKWETADAVPEIGKLLALAQNFGVTTDWLLSEEEPEEVTSSEKEAQEAYEQKEEAKESYYKETVNWSNDAEATAGSRTTANTDWMDELPGFLGKMVKKFGWLAGVYIAVSGVGVTMIGLIALLISSLMISNFNNASSYMVGMSSQPITIYDNEGNVIKDSGFEEQLGELIHENYGIDSNATTNYYLDSGAVVDYYITPAENYSATYVTESNPVSILAGGIIFIGVMMIIAGTSFAIVWKQKSME